MKRLLVLLLAIGVTLSVASSCEVIGTNVAATVDGKDITVTQVTQLAKVLAQQGSAAQSGGAASVEDSTKGLDSTAAQKSLSQWIQLVGAERALARRGSSPSSSAQQSAASSTKSLKGVSVDTRTRLTTGVAALNTLLAKLAVDSNPTFHKLALQALKSVPEADRKQVCSQAIYGPASAADQVQKLLDSGATLDDPTAFSATGYSAATQDKTLCVGQSDLPADLASAYFNAPAGTVEHATFSSQGSSGAAESDTLFFKIVGTTTITAKSSSIAQKVVQAVQSQPGLLLGPEFKKLSIEIDPRFGSGYDWRTGDVTPPASPLVPTTRPAKSKAQVPISVPESANTPTSTPSG